MSVNIIMVRSSLTAASHNVRDGALMVIHGTQDDNVHIEHTMSLSRELVENDIIFRQQVMNLSIQPDRILLLIIMLDWTEITLSCYQIYPDESHGLFGVTRHLYETMEAFLDEIYGPIEDYFEDDYYLAAAKLLEVT